MSPCLVNDSARHCIPVYRHTDLQNTNSTMRQALCFLLSAYVGVKIHSGLLRFLKLPLKGPQGLSYGAGLNPSLPSKQVRGALRLKGDGWGAVSVLSAM